MVDRTFRKGTTKTKLILFRHIFMAIMYFEQLVNFEKFALDNGLILLFQD